MIPRMACYLLFYEFNALLIITMRRDVDRKGKAEEAKFYIINYN